MFEQIEEVAEGLRKEAFLNHKAAINLDDIFFVPQYSEVETRDDISLKTKIFIDCNLDIPIIASPMDMVSGSQMLATMASIGGSAILHRNCSPDEQSESFIKALNLYEENNFYIKIMNRYLGLLLIILLGKKELIKFTLFIELCVMKNNIIFILKYI